MRLSVLLFSLLLGCSMVSGQAVSVGVKGGVPFLDRTNSNDESRPYIVGPSVEVRLPAHFAVEADALYQRIGNTFYGGYSFGVPNTFVTSRERGNSWEFSLLGKYYFRSRQASWRPYIATGYSLRTIWYHYATSQVTSGSNLVNTYLTYKGDLRSDLGVGAVVAAGVRYRIGRFSVLPEVRYTRWGGSEANLRKNEAAVIVGLNF